MRGQDQTLSLGCDGAAFRVITLPCCLGGYERGDSACVQVWFRVGGLGIAPDLALGGRQPWLDEVSWPPSSITPRALRGERR